MMDRRFTKECFTIDSEYFSARSFSRVCNSKSPMFRSGAVVEVGALNPEHPIAPDHLGNEHPRRREFLYASAFRDILILCRRFVDLNIDAFKIAENSLYLGAYIVPIKSSVSGAEWRQSD